LPKIAYCWRNRFFDSVFSNDQVSLGIESMTPGHYSRGLEGHRAAYLEFVISRFGGCRVRALELFLWPGPVLFLMVEENFGLYLFAALWRALLGRRTVGLLFRPGPAVDGKSFRLRLKRIILKALRQLPFVCTLSIIPVPLNPKIAGIVDGWIHDFQLWDLSDVDHERFLQLRALGNDDGDVEVEAVKILSEARCFAAGRPLLVALGAQNHNKGVELLAESMATRGTEGWAVLVAGRFAQEVKTARDTIEAHGGRVIDRFLSDDEMLALYAAADAVWCLYDPAYDQASGILGRTIQLGIFPIVRRGSFSEAFCRAEGVAYAAAVGGTDMAAALTDLVRPTLTGPRQVNLTARWAELNTKRILMALGLQTGKHSK
jgi:hypothetical protein